MGLSTSQRGCWGRAAVEAHGAQPSRTSGNRAGLCTCPSVRAPRRVRAVEGGAGRNSWGRQGRDCWGGVRRAMRRPGAVIQSTMWHRRRGCVQEDRNENQGLAANLAKQCATAQCHVVLGPHEAGCKRPQNSHTLPSGAGMRSAPLPKMPHPHQAGSLRTLVVVEPLLSDRERPLPQTLLQITHSCPNPTAGPAGAMLRRVHGLTHHARGQPSLSPEVLEVQGPGVLELRHRGPMRTGHLAARARLLVSAW